ncbi:MAG: MFS transporter [Polyangiaceae bacterium]|nr:MFS transporter [Polyangiaceae bacterium]
MSDLDQDKGVGGSSGGPTGDRTDGTVGAETGSEKQAVRSVFFAADDSGSEGSGKQSEDADPEKKSVNPFMEIVQPFVDLVSAPRVLWGINAAYFIEGMVYFGMLMYMAMYFNQYVGLSDEHAGYMVGVLTSGITLSMFFFGGLADKVGVRRALIGAFVLMIVGRLAMAAAPSLGFGDIGLNSAIHWIAMAGIVLIVLGYGMYMPAAYSGIRQFTTPKTAGMAFAMLYALMNLGGWLPTFFSPLRREYGIAGSYWVFSFATVLALGLTVVLLTRKVVDKTIADVKAEKEAAKDADQKSRDAAQTAKVDAALQRAKKEGAIGVAVHWLRTHPLADPKFAFFIFALIPVQTLFAHNWLTLPVYVERAFAPPASVEVCEGMEPTGKSLVLPKESSPVADYVDVVRKYDGYREGCEAKRVLRAIASNKPSEADSAAVARVEEAKKVVRTWDYAAVVDKVGWSERARLWLGENFEVAVNFNPLLIFILVPIVTALTQRKKVYNMMIVGTFVMAAPTFLLVIGANFWTLLGFLVIMTIGEAMWQPRFLQYAAEIAPEGRTAAYMGVAQFPWFLTKMLVPLYSGRFLAAYVPSDGPVNSEQMWLIYGLIAISSTVMLVIAKGWVGKDFKTQAS